MSIPPSPEAGRPHKSVRVGFWTFEDYEIACRTFGGGPDNLAWWLDLGDLLAHRPGWHFDIAAGAEALWSLGLEGASLLNIEVVEKHGGYSCYDREEDADAYYTDIPAVEAWLEVREERYSGLTEMQLKAARETNWKYFRRYPFRMQASWSDGTWQVSLPGVYDVTFGATLTEAINNAAEMICRLYQAPLELAPELNAMKVELDEAATTQLRRQG